MNSSLEIYENLTNHNARKSASEMSDEESKCPVDHSTREAWLGKAKASTGIQKTEDESACPVSPETRTSWLSKVSLIPKFNSESIEESSHTSENIQESTISQVDLPVEREISSIPRTATGTNWVYPSQKQFFEAMKRKNWNPEKDDMKTIVPIHNAVNELVWKHVLMWESSYREESIKKCGGIKLSSFKGDSKKLTPRAWFKSNILGQEAPFDRHDWKVDRCGTEIEYVIDFYGGQNGADYFVDVRPKFNTWEGTKLRLGRAFGLF